METGADALPRESPERRTGQASSETQSRPSGALTLLFAVASGLAVSNVYFANPMLDLMADEFGMSHARAGWIVAATQIGYGLGLILLVPLGDILDRRRLVITQSLLSVIALLSIALAPGSAALLASMAVMGFLAVATQSFVAYAASLTGPGERGHVVGIVTSGIVLGILMARTIAGTLADLSGWRMVYVASALATLVVAASLVRGLPRQSRPPRGATYPQLIGSLFRLLLAEPALRIRGVIAMLIFANITTLLTPLVLPLSAPPFGLSHTEVGLFGLAGIAGALAASRAGRWTDRGWGQRTTGIALILMLLAWLPIALLEHSLLLLVIGVIVIDFGLQAVHVTNQAMIYRVRPEAQSRLTAGYMVFYSIGSAFGSSASTYAYAQAGWPGVCFLGTAISAATLSFWLLTRRAMPDIATAATGHGRDTPCRHQVATTWRTPKMAVPQE